MISLKYIFFFGGTTKTMNPLARLQVETIKEKLPVKEMMLHFSSYNHQL